MKVCALVSVDPLNMILFLMALPRRDVQLNEGDRDLIPGWRLLYGDQGLATTTLTRKLHRLGMREVVVPDSIRF